MQSITNAEDLQNAIEQLEEQQKEEARLLKTQILALYENFKPMNIIKNSIEEFASSPENEGKLVVATMGLAAGMISKKLIVGHSDNPVTKAVGTLLQVGISSLIMKSPETLKSLTGGILSFFTKKEKNEVNSH